MKKQITTITITRAEGPNDADFSPYTVPTWDTANARLQEITASSLTEGIKIDYTLTYENGFKYSGTIETSKNFESLQDHIRWNLAFKMGLNRANLPEEKYAAMLRYMGEEAITTAHWFAASYQIG